MGSGSSSNTAVKNTGDDIKDVLDNRADPKVEEIIIADIEEGYPPPRPPRRKKSDVFQIENFEDIDRRAKETPVELTSSWDQLVGYLSDGYQTDLEVVRAIFIWLCVQSMETIPENVSGKKDTPMAYLIKVIKSKTVSYATLFARLCRTAKVPCVLIRGHGKSSAYEVGDIVEQVKQLYNVWNAVFIDDDWRLIIPMWACQAAGGHSSGDHSSGKYTLIKSKDNTPINSTSESSSVSTIDEFFFMADPEELAVLLIASNPLWQLLEEPITIERFCSVPNMQPDYFKYNFSFKSEFSCVVHSKYGVCEFVFESGDTLSEGILVYDIYFNHEESEKQFPTDLQFERYVIKERIVNKWIFTVRFPLTGVYKICFYGGLKEEATFLICNFKVCCEKLKENIQPLPCDPGMIGFGPRKELNDVGLTSPSHLNGIIQINRRQFINISFAITKKVSVRTELVHDQISTELLLRNLLQWTEKKRLYVKVHVPRQGEYVLRIYSKSKLENTEKNVCNYLLTSDDTLKKKRSKELPIEIRIREYLKYKTDTATNSHDFDDAIAKFKKFNLEDKGDLTRAYGRQTYLQIRQDLRDAINRQRTDTLEKVIKRTYDSEFVEELKPLIIKAESMIERVRKLTDLNNHILELEHKTFVEVMRYEASQPITYHIVKAMLVILGEDPEYLEDWIDVRMLVRQSGELSLMTRIKDFDWLHLTAEMVECAEEMLNLYETQTVQNRSAALLPFYLWCRHVCDEFIKKTRTSTNGSISIVETPTNLKL